MYFVHVGDPKRKNHLPHHFWGLEMGNLVKWDRAVSPGEYHSTRFDCTIPLIPSLHVYMYTCIHVNDTEIYKITGKFVSKLWGEREGLMGAIK